MLTIVSKSKWFQIINAVFFAYFLLVFIVNCILKRSIIGAYEEVYQYGVAKIKKAIISEVSLIQIHQLYKFF